jgi:hypothetical protein
MKNQKLFAPSLDLLVIVIISLNFPPYHLSAANQPPTVGIVWPPSNTLFTVFGGGAVTKIKAEATDPDGSVDRVMFYYDETNLMGVVTSPPFTLLWPVHRLCPFGCFPGRFLIKAVAVDNEGEQTESGPVRIFVSSTRPESVMLQIVSPANGAILPTPATFTFSAEFMSSHGGVEPVRFYVDGDLVGTAGEPGLLSVTSPPVSIVVTNLSEGEHLLSVETSSGCICFPITNTVVALSFKNTGVAPDGRFQSEVRTPYLGRPNIVEVSSNLFDWFPLITNQPASISFTFMDSPPIGDTNRYYRVRVPPP